MRERKKASAFKSIEGFVFAISFAQLSFYQIVTYDAWIIGATMVLSFLCGLLVYKRIEEENIAYLKDHPKMALTLFVVAIMLIYAMYQVKGIPNKTVPFPPFSLRLFRLRYWLIATPALFFLLVWLGKTLGKFICKLWQGMDQMDRKIYLWGTVILSLVVMIFYTVEPNWYLQYDKVYSIDSGWCYKNLYPQLSYYDIRHPTLSIITFPLWALSRGLLSLFVPANLINVLCVTCVQLVNVQLLLLAGAMIRELSKSKWTFLIYLASFSVLTFTMFFEKYQICTFLLVLYAYLTCKRENGREISLILATGAMPTSILLFGNELFIREPLAAKIKRIFNIAMCGIMVLICTGRIHLLVPQVLLSETAAKAQRFGLKNLPIEGCAASFINMVHGAFLSLSSKSGEEYLWADITHSVSLVGCVIFATVIIGLISNYKDKFIKLCAIWMSAGIVLFGIFQWGVKESPLFSIYFAWAAIPLFQKGIQIIIEKMRWKETVVYPSIIATMLTINVLTIIDIGKFLQTF